jgi:hypothetical protein
VTAEVSNCPLSPISLKLASLSVIVIVIVIGSGDAEMRRD